MRNRRDGRPESWRLKASVAAGVTAENSGPLTAEPPPLTPWGVGPAAEPQFRGLDLRWLWAVPSGPASPASPLGPVWSPLIDLRGSAWSAH